MENEGALALVESAGMSQTGCWRCGRKSHGYVEVCVSCLSPGKSRPFDILRTIKSCALYLPHLTSLTHGIFSNWYWCLD